MTPTVAVMARNAEHGESRHFVAHSTNRLIVRPNFSRAIVANPARAGAA